MDLCCKTLSHTHGVWMYETEELIKILGFYLFCFLWCSYFNCSTLKPDRAGIQRRSRWDPLVLNQCPSFMFLMGDVTDRDVAFMFASYKAHAVLF